MTAGGQGREAPIGVLCFDTSFTKIPGHIRNPATFDFPVVCQVVPGATAQRMVTQADPALLGPFTEAARDLQAQGVAAITGACGFLALFQRQLAGAVTVPLFASSLLQLPMVHRMTGSVVGLVVAQKRSLTSRHLAAVGAQDVPVCVTGMEDQPEFREVMLEARRDELDVPRLRQEVLAQVRGLVRDNPGTGAILLECTDLVPFAHAIQHLTGLPVFDIVTLTELVHQALTRRPYRARPVTAPAGNAAAAAGAGQAPP